MEIHLVERNEKGAFKNKEIFSLPDFKFQLEDDIIRAIEKQSFMQRVFSKRFKFDVANSSTDLMENHFRVRLKQDIN